MAGYIGQLGEFNEAKEDFESYVERLDQWSELNGIDSTKKANVLLSVIGPTSYKLLKDILTPEKPKDKSYVELCDALKGHYSPKPLVIAERFRFYKRGQKEGESVADYVITLKQLSGTCEFGEFLPHALRDRLVCGLRDENIQRRLLTTKELTFQSAKEVAIAMELATRSEVCLRATGESVNKVTYSPRHGSGRAARKPEKSRRNECYRCGEDHNPERCHFKTAVCYVCNKVGHLARKCRGNNRRNTSQSQMTKSQSQNVRYVGVVADESDIGIYTCDVGGAGAQPIFAEVDIGGNAVRMQVDTGAAKSLIPETLYLRHFAHLALQPTNLTLRTYTQEVIEHIGVVTLDVRHGDQRAELSAVVVKGDKTPLLGRDWLAKMKLDWSSILAVTAIARHSVEEVLKGHSEIFQEGTGTIKGYTAHIYMKEDVQPRFHKARPVPYALRDKVEHELDRLEKERIIQKVDHSDWSAPIVVVPKANKTVRICGDFKVTINPNVEREHYPLPNVEDLFASLAGGKVFSKLDLSHAYQQLELDAESQHYVTVNTHKGTYRYLRMPYGVSSAPSIFQSVMDQILQGMDHVMCFLDDILITAESEQEHLKLLDEVLTRLEKCGVRVNLAKCEFAKKSVDYLGHLIDAEGIHPTSEKLDAITNSQKPKDVKELRSYLGLINYYAKFIPRMSTVLRPLHLLLMKDREWRWTPECDDAMQKCTDLLTSQQVLVHYDCRKPLRLATDASPTGVGAVLSHVMENGDEKPIAFASRTLSSSECNYAQIEKEALSIIFGVKKFHKYLYGRSFTLITDHKPLVTIFGPKTAVPTLAALRMQRWALILQAYHYGIEYRKSEDHANADALSRLPLPTTTTEEPAIFEVSVVDDLPVKARDIAVKTRSDPLLSRVLEYVLTGWPNHTDKELQVFFAKRDELSTEQGCLLWGSRVLVPSAYHQAMLDELHSEHSGVSQTKAFARSYIWWPGMDNDIETMVQACAVCQSVKNQPAVAPLHPWPWPTRIWQRIHIDFAEKDGVNYLIVVDSHSKWLEAVAMRSTTSAKTIEVLRGMFASHGLPEEVVSDNGPQFIAHEFKTFMDKNGIKHTRVAPYHPASNGAAERCVQTVKQSLRKYSVGTQLTKESWLANFLLRYRCTPHTVTGVSPAELFLKRRLRNRFSLLKPHLERHMEEKQTQQKEQHDRSRVKLRELVSGDPVHVRNHRGSGPPKWVAGKIIRRLGPLTYLVQVRAQRRYVHVDHLRLKVR